MSLSAVAGSYFLYCLSVERKKGCASCGFPNVLPGVEKFSHPIWVAGKEVLASWLDPQRLKLSVLVWLLLLSLFQPSISSPCHCILSQNSSLNHSSHFSLSFVATAGHSSVCWLTFVSALPGLLSSEPSPLQHYVRSADTPPKPTSFLLPPDYSWCQALTPRSSTLASLLAIFVSFSPAPVSVSLTPSFITGSILSPGP